MDLNKIGVVTVILEKCVTFDNTKFATKQRKRQILSNILKLIEIPLKYTKNIFKHYYPAFLETFTQTKKQQKSDTICTKQQKHD